MGRAKRPLAVTRVIGTAAVALTALGAPGVAIAASAEPLSLTLAFESGREVRGLRSTDLAEIFYDLDQMARLVEQEIASIRRLDVRIDMSTLLKLELMQGRVANLRSLIQICQVQVALR